MPKLPRISGIKLVKILKKQGYTIISQKGRHIKMRHGQLTVIIPNHKIIKPGTLRNGILKTIGMSPEQLRRLL
jgi:predicted RNA binding protein YcfA (HicA-like mRNA interferase family)